MTYIMQWDGKSDPDDKSGTARYMIEGEVFAIPLPNFADAQRLDGLLWLAFQQGKSFAFNAVKSHISGAMRQADSTHGLTMPSSALSRRDGAGTPGVIGKTE